MSLAGYAFVQGFTGDVRNSIEKREEADRDRKKTIFLEELRRDTYKWQAEYDAARAKSKSDKDMTQFDYDRGVKILKNADGDTLREVPLTKSEREEYDLGIRKSRAGVATEETKARYADQEARLGLERDRAAIDASRASADSSRASARATRRGLSSIGADDDLMGGSGAAKYERRIQEMMYKNQGIVSDLEEAGVPRETIEEFAANALDAAAERGDPAEAYTLFRQGAPRLRARARGAKWNTRPAGGLESAGGGTMFTPKP